MAEVRVRVVGVVNNGAFDEGADVKAGDVLFPIESAPFKAALGRAEGQLAQAAVHRYESPVNIYVLSQRNFDAAKAALQSAEAIKRSAQADVQTARLELEYSTANASISGRIGRAEVAEGALVVGRNA